MKITFPPPPPPIFCHKSDFVLKNLLILVSYMTCILVLTAMDVVYALLNISLFWDTRFCHLSKVICSPKHFTFLRYKVLSSKQSYISHVSFILQWYKTYKYFHLGWVSAIGSSMWQVLFFSIVLSGLLMKVITTHIFSKLVSKIVLFTHKPINLGRFSMKHKPILQVAKWKCTYEWHQLNIYQSTLKFPIIFPHL